MGLTCSPSLLYLCKVTILLFLPDLFFSFSPFSGVSSSVSDFSISVSKETLSSESSDAALLFLDIVSFFFVFLAGEFCLDLACLSLFLEDDCGLLLFLLWDLPLSPFNVGQSLFLWPGFLQCQQGLLQSLDTCPGQ